MSDVVKFYRDTKGEWRWHRQSENGRIVADSGEGYTDRVECVAMAMEVNGEQVRYLNGGGDDA